MPKRTELTGTLIVTSKPSPEFRREMAEFFAPLIRESIDNIRADKARKSQKKLKRDTLKE